MSRDRGGPKGGMWIALHDGMPDHPKIEDLSDRAFRALVTLWCWCGRHLTDGQVTATVWRKKTTPAVRRELLAARLVDPHDDGSIEIHDFLDWQRSAADVEQVTEVKRKAGHAGNHQRWHVERGIVDGACELCAAEIPAPPAVEEEDAPPPVEEDDAPPPDESQVRSHMRVVPFAPIEDSGRVSDANNGVVSNDNYRSHTGDAAIPAQRLTSDNTRTG